MKTTTDEVRQILAEVLPLEDQVSSFDESTPLLGSLPEMDSMTVVSIITALEEHFGFTVGDEIDAEAFETLGTLVKYVENRI